MTEARAETASQIHFRSHALAHRLTVAAERLSRPAMRHVPAGPDEPGYPWWSEARLRELLIEEGLSTEEAAEECGCHPDTIRKWARRHGFLEDR